MKSAAVEDITFEQMFSYLRKKYARVLSASRLKEDLTSVFNKIEKDNVGVAEIRMNIETYRYLREHMSQDLDIVTDYAEVRKGHHADLWGAEIWLDKLLADGNVVVTDIKPDEIVKKK